MHYMEMKLHWTQEALQAQTRVVLARSCQRVICRANLTPATRTHRRQRSPDTLLS